jgi:NAD(P)-dependent dehydrogenase (short-subunit alcohol dehydrogenase family)
MDLQLAGKRALVTGGSKGIGRAIASRLALEGADVVIAARGLDALEAAAQSLAIETGRKVSAVQGDVGDTDSVKRLMEDAVSALGGLDILVNCGAAITMSEKRPPKLAELEEETFTAYMNVKPMGYIRTAKEAVPHMLAAGWGRIINVGGQRTRETGSTMGSMRNAAVAALTKNLADELGPQGINCTVVIPGFTRTDNTQEKIAYWAKDRGVDTSIVESKLSSGISIGRILEASEVANVVGFLCSPLSVAINGDAVAVNGGMRGAIYY